MQILGHTNIFRFVGDLVHLLSVFIILFKMLRHRSCAGLSMKSQLAYALVFTARYVPGLVTGHLTSWYLLAMKLFFLVSSWYIVFLMRFRNPWKASYSRDLDSLKMRYLVLPCLVLALFFHYDVEAWGAFFIEILWTFSQYLEAIAIMPQLLVLTKQLERGEQWEIMNGHYVASLGAYRGLYVLNWIYRYWVEGRQNWVDTTAGVVQTLLFADFFVTYVKGIMQLGKDALPGGK
eukprot:Hpha_TRINITY_DN4580_c0_g1::TRINITY_DN4580_c0_g1_i1::g.115391::m.115391/K10949/KDELR; ER lumen protein retaining receptor